MADVLVLFDEYAAAFARGEQPDLRAYLARAGDGADELAMLVDGFLVRAEPPAPQPGQVALAASWAAGRSPLLELRTRRGLRRDDVVAALVRTLGLDLASSPKVKRYFQQLESGLLEPYAVDRRVWDALAAALRAPVDALRAWRPLPPPAPAQPELSRALGPAAPAPAMGLPASKAAATERDEVDRLFGK